MTLTIRTSKAEVISGVGSMFLRLIARGVEEGSRRSKPKGLDAAPLSPGIWSFNHRESVSDVVEGMGVSQ